MSFKSKLKQRINEKSHNNWSLTQAVSKRSKKIAETNDGTTIIPKFVERHERKTIEKYPALQGAGAGNRTSNLPALCRGKRIAALKEKIVRSIPDEMKQPGKKM